MCGCDGVRYCNACTAHAARASVDTSTSQCDRSCRTAKDCPLDGFCLIPDGCEGRGTCKLVDPDDGCPTIYAPVCGCDGNDYSNRCMALYAKTNVDHEGNCDASSSCTSDADCAFGEQWCAGGRCIPCDNATGCDVDCIVGWEPYQRNGCSPCACAPANECDKDDDCGAGDKCYAGAMCWEWCPPDDPSCCMGNICSAAGCTTPPPVGCFVRGCPLGEDCVEGCTSSGCDCGGQGSGWGCDDDCSGGVCVQDQ